MGDTARAYWLDLFTGTVVASFPLPGVATTALC